MPKKETFTTGNLENPFKVLLIVSVFNTIIALILYYFILREKSFSSLFIISQFIGLSISLSVNRAEVLMQKTAFEYKKAGLAAALLCGTLFGTSLAWVYLTLFYNIELGYFFKNFFAHMLLLGIIFGLPIIYFFISKNRLIEAEQRLKDEQIKRLIIEKEAAMTSLKLFQAQIEPHFLFNTLSTIISLVETDTRIARQMLTDLNVYLRSCLTLTRQEMTTLSHELQTAEHYLNLFKIRMGDRLMFTITDETRNPDFPIPPMIIQPLVENSIKYGLEPCAEGGSIAIHCRADDSFLEITISDTGLGIDGTIDSTGVGIDNVSRRLENIYGDPAELIIKNNTPKGTVAIIRVPL